MSEVSMINTPDVTVGASSTETRVIVTPQLAVARLAFGEPPHIARRVVSVAALRSSLSTMTEQSARYLSQAQLWRTSYLALAEEVSRLCIAVEQHNAWVGYFITGTPGARAVEDPPPEELMRSITKNPILVARWTRARLKGMDEALAEAFLAPIILSEAAGFQREQAEDLGFEEVVVASRRHVESQVTAESQNDADISGSINTEVTE